MYLPEFSRDTQPGYKVYDSIVDASAKFRYTMDDLRSWGKSIKDTWLLENSAATSDPLGNKADAIFEDTTAMKAQIVRLQDQNSVIMTELAEIKRMIVNRYDNLSQRSPRGEANNIIPRATVTRVITPAQPLAPYAFDLEKKRASFMFVEWYVNKLDSRLRWASGENIRFKANKVERVVKEMKKLETQDERIVLERHIPDYGDDGYDDVVKELRTVAVSLEEKLVKKLIAEERKLDIVKSGTSRPYLNSLEGRMSIVNRLDKKRKLGSSPQKNKGMANTTSFPSIFFDKI